MTEMLRYNQGKPQLSYFPSSFWRAYMEICEDDYNIEFVNAVTAVLEFGAKKYSKNNWRTSGSWCRVADSALRHLLWYMDGESHDRESGLPHLAHVGCNIMFLIEFQASKSGVDDRYVRPANQAIPEYDHDRPALNCITDLLARWLESENPEYLDGCLYILSSLYGEETSEMEEENDDAE